jgi:hypothetical protein
MQIEIDIRLFPEFTGKNGRVQYTAAHSLPDKKILAVDLAEVTIILR